MRHIFILTLSFCVFNLAQAKSSSDAIDFSIDGKVLMTVRQLESVKLSSEPMPVIAPEQKPTQVGSFTALSTTDDKTKKLWDITFTLIRADGEKFKTLTEGNIGKKLAVSFRGKTLFAANVNAPITGGHVNFVVPKEKEARLVFKKMKTLETAK